jgi:hypothetical protein
MLIGFQEVRERWKEGLSRTRTRTIWLQLRRVVPSLLNPIGVKTFDNHVGR